MATAVSAPPAIDQLAPTFRGTLLQAGQEGFDQARMVWNGMFDRRPGLIARCTGAADVIAAVNFARKSSMPETRGMLMSVRTAS